MPNEQDLKPQDPNDPTFVSPRVLTRGTSSDEAAPDRGGGTSHHAARLLDVKIAIARVEQTRPEPVVA